MILVLYLTFCALLFVCYFDVVCMVIVRCGRIRRRYHILRHVLSQNFINETVITCWGLDTRGHFWQTTFIILTFIFLEATLRFYIHMSLWPIWHIVGYYLNQSWWCSKIGRDHSGYAFSQWEDALLCNTSSHGRAPTTRMTLTMSSIKPSKLNELSVHCEVCWYSGAMVHHQSWKWPSVASVTLSAVGHWPWQRLCVDGPSLLARVDGFITCQSWISGTENINLYIFNFILPLCKNSMAGVLFIRGGDSVSCFDNCWRVISFPRVAQCC